MKLLTAAHPAKQVQVVVSNIGGMHHAKPGPRTDKDGNHLPEARGFCYVNDLAAAIVLLCK